MGTENTCSEPVVAPCTPVHLRGYGEHVSRLLAVAGTTGSSPWVRRTPQNQISRRLHDTVHLRGYGEHISWFSHCYRLIGSSPWVRRTLSIFRSITALSRFISVGTENTFRSNKLYESITVHLRGYGEHTTETHFTASAAGSSPWVRRTP